MFSPVYQKENGGSKRQVSCGGQQQHELSKGARSTLPSTSAVHSLPTRALLLSAGHRGGLGEQPGTSPSTAQDEQPQRERRKFHVLEHRHLPQITWLPEEKQRGRGGTRQRAPRAVPSNQMHPQGCGGLRPALLCYRPWRGPGHSPGPPRAALTDVAAELSAGSSWHSRVTAEPGEGTGAHGPPRHLQQLRS